MRMGDLEPWQLTKIPHALSARLPFLKGDFRSLRSLFRNFRKINTLFKGGKKYELSQTILLRKCNLSCVCAN